MQINSFPSRIFPGGQAPVQISSTYKRKTQQEKRKSVSIPTLSQDIFLADSRNSTKSETPKKKLGRESDKLQQSNDKSMYHRILF
ncbi:hypothetical protein CEXT_469191 [Caerostris extrusa]|uniref:Uncharacterized protein n=1 Tax=Caerostris extrusa TaxID=172846 RepID=A0AAV4R5Q8_CAEEX|nr:hypothetical protein CEXT_469191 [Caerostris extrusa]